MLQNEMFLSFNPLHELLFFALIHTFFHFLLQNKHKIIPHFFLNDDFKRSIHTINASRKYSQGTEHFRQLF